tara:strand:+ start:149 stop:373 length:225 start_codon:yes stop_codon:yes gene_type:complete
MSITWNTGLAAERARHNLKLKKKRRPAAKAASRKRQDYINGERLQHLLGWKGSSDLGPKPQASSSKRHETDTIE